MYQKEEAPGAELWSLLFSTFGVCVLTSECCSLGHKGCLSAPPAAAAESLQSCPTLRPHRQQPTRLLHPWDSPGKNTGVGCHFFLQCMKVKSESEVAQSCPPTKNQKDGDAEDWGLLPTQRGASTPSVASLPPQSPASLPCPPTLCCLPFLEGLCI